MSNILYFVVERDHGTHQTAGSHHMEVRDDGKENGRHGVFYANDE